MAGTKIGGKRAAKTNLLKYGKDFYSKIGSEGGKATGKKGFALMPKDKVRAAGSRGGKRSKR